jgi:hypothetical protein
MAHDREPKGSGERTGRDIRHIFRLRGTRRADPLSKTYPDQATSRVPYVRDAVIRPDIFRPGPQDLLGLRDATGFPHTRCPSHLAHSALASQPSSD